MKLLLLIIVVISVFIGGFFTGRLLIIRDMPISHKIQSLIKLNPQGLAAAKVEMLITDITHHINALSDQCYQIIDNSTIDAKVLDTMEQLSLIIKSAAYLVMPVPKDVRQQALWTEDLVEGAMMIEHSTYQRLYALLEDKREIPYNTNYSRPAPEEEPYVYRVCDKAFIKIRELLYMPMGHHDDWNDEQSGIGVGLMTANDGFLDLPFELRDKIIHQSIKRHAWNYLEKHLYSDEEYKE
ncbi:hypothetical protein KAR34_13530 [bacterium]|nr:hypothetical protein [bacterium]